MPDPEQEHDLDSDATTERHRQRMPIPPPPIPDPTTLTTDALRREIGHIRDWTTTFVNGETALVEEQLREVNRRFRSLEEQRVEQKADTKEAVDAALAAAKEAVKEQTKSSSEGINKTETLTKQQLNQQAEQTKEGLSVLSEKIDDLKERLTRSEQAILTAKDIKGVTIQQVGSMLALMGFLLAFFVAIANGAFAK